MKLVYKESLDYIVAKAGDLSFLEYAADARGEHDLPSWLPDLRASGNTEPRNKHAMNLNPET